MAPRQGRFLRQCGLDAESFTTARSSISGAFPLDLNTRAIRCSPPCPRIVDRVRPPHGCQHTRPLHAHIILVSTGLYRPPRRSIFPCLIAILGTNITILNERRCTMQSSLTTFPACPLQHMLLQWIRKEPFQYVLRVERRVGKESLG